MVRATKTATVLTFTALVVTRAVPPDSLLILTVKLTNFRDSYGVERGEWWVRATGGKQLVRPPKE